MNPIQMMQMVNQIRQNPGQMLSQYGIPQNIMNDPKAIVQHLMNSGRVSQSQYDQAMQTAKGFGIRI